MVYSSKFALAVKVNNQVLRESEDTVLMPFGQEYSLLVKNLNSVRALVKIWIDGSDATEGTSGLIVPPNTSVDLERFIKNGNLNEGNKFKFIERTAAVSEHRGNKIDDGLIRVEFQFEKIQQIMQLQHKPLWPQTQLNGPVYGIGGATAVSDSGIRGITRNATVGSVSASTEVGITVPGSVSSQQFTWGESFSTDGVLHVLVLRILGEVQGTAVQVPITVKHKPACVTCGKLNTWSSKFCDQCGTGLSIVA